MPIARTILVGAKIFDEREAHSLETAPQFSWIDPVSPHLSGFRNRCQNPVGTFECCWICEDRCVDVCKCQRAACCKCACPAKDRINGVSSQVVGDPFPNGSTSAVHVKAISHECLCEWFAIEVNRHLYDPQWIEARSH